jgi:uroporphyrinogen decarboxylase
MLWVCPTIWRKKEARFFRRTLRSAADVNRLRIADGNDNLQHTITAVSLVRQTLAGRVPLIGFAAAPWTLLSYMVEGSGSKTFSEAKKMLYCAPDVAHRALEKITQSTINYLKAQIHAGADVVQIFDSWAGVLSPEQYSTFSARYIHQICQAIDEVPVTVFAKGAFFCLIRNCPKCPAKLSDLIGILSLNSRGKPWANTKYCKAI